MDARRLKIETQAVAAGRPEPLVMGAAVTPIFQSAVWEHTSEGGSYLDVRYPRMQNLPGHRALSVKLAALEDGEAATVAASGMAAITAALLETLGPGGHLLAQDQLYGGTHSFVVHDLARFGLAFDFLDSRELSGWAARLRPRRWPCA